MNFSGLIIGVVTFFTIGIFHPIVIKCEYYFGKRCWWVFLVVGLLGVIGSIVIKNLLCSVLLGVFAFSCFWSIRELYEQEERVAKGWFPSNPKRTKSSKK